MDFLDCNSFLEKANSCYINCIIQRNDTQSDFNHQWIFKNNNK